MSLRRALFVVALLGVVVLGLLFGTRTGRALVVSTDAFVPLPADSRVRYAPGMEAEAEQIAQRLPEALEQVARAQYRPFADDVTIFVCATQEQFNIHVPVGTRARGATFLGEVYLSPRTFTTATQEAILVHELSHLHLQQHLGAFGYMQRLPAWFQEGLAVFVSGGGGAELATPQAARQALIAGQTLMPEDDGAWLRPRTASAHGLTHPMFYRQSGLFVAYLHDRDATAFQRFMNALHDGEPFATAFALMGGPVHNLWVQFVQSLHDQDQA